MESRRILLVYHVADSVDYEWQMLLVLTLAVVVYKFLRVDLLFEVLSRDAVSK